MARSGNKGRPHRSKPYEIKQAERAAARRAAQTGRSHTQWHGETAGDNPDAPTTDASRPLSQQRPGQQERREEPSPGSDVIQPPE